MPRIQLFLFCLGWPLATAAQPIDSTAFRQLFDSIETLNNRGRYAESLDLSQQLHDRVLEEHGAMHPLTAKACQALGVAFLRQGEPAKAAPPLLQCIGILKSLHGEDHVELPTACNALGTLYSESGQPHKALPLLEEALRILRLHFPPGHPTFAQTFNNLGVAHDLLGEYDKALEYYQLSLAAKRASPKAAPIQVSNSLNNIAAVLQYSGQLEKAIWHYQQSLAVLEQAGLQSTQEYALGLMNLGSAWFAANNQFLSRKHLDAANELAQSAFSPRSYNKGSLKLNLGINYLEMGEIAEAEASITAALDIFRDNFGEGSYFDLYCLLPLGTVRLKQGLPDSARVLFQQALDAAVANLGPHHGHAVMAMNNLGLACSRMNDPEAAILAFRGAIEKHEEKFAAAGLAPLPSVDYLDALVNLLDMLLEKHLQSGNAAFPGELDKLLEKCLSVLETMKSGAADPLSRMTLLEDNYKLVELALRIALLTNPRRCFELAEQHKAWTLLSAADKNGAVNFASLPAQMLEREQSLRTRIAFFKRSCAENIDNLDFQAALVARVQADSLQASLDSLKRSLALQHADYFDLRHNLSSIPLPEAQQLLKPGETMIGYFNGDSSLFILLVQPDDFQVREVKKDFPLEAWVDDLRLNICQKRSTGAKGYAQAAANLYDKLLRPVEPLLTEHLIIIPDGVLGHLPFEALLTRQPGNPAKYASHPYLLKKHRISYCYSATMLKKMRERQHRHPPAREFVAFAPYYTGNLQELEFLQPYQFSTDSLYAGLRSYTPDWSLPLEASGREVNTLRELTGGLAFYGSQATEACFDSLAGQFRIIHLATHGIADSRVGDYSFLAFHLIADKLENELLYVRDLYDLELNADMVVLSACETGLGELRRGEGIISLARAFAYAGAKSIVNTLWRVDDDSTSQLMVDFYYYLKQGKEKDEALRLAKLAFLKKQPLRALPYFWAGVIPVGDMSAPWPD